MSSTCDVQNLLEECIRRSHEGSIDFPSVVKELIEAGVESYQVDYRRKANTYYLSSGEVYSLNVQIPDLPIAVNFHQDKVQELIKGAQTGRVKYQEFVRLTMQSGCVGYIVWISGRQVTYFGRCGEIHIEPFPARP